MKTAIASLLLLWATAPAYAGPLCNGLIDRVVSAANSPFPFQCECGLRIFRRVRFNCEATVCLNDVDGLVSGVLPFTLPILNRESVCLNPSFRGRFPKRGNGDIDVGGCTGGTTMRVDIDQMVQDHGPDGATAASLELDDEMDFNIPNACLDVTTNSRPGLGDPSISISGCSASIQGTACTCTVCGGGSGIEIGADCVDALFSTMIPPELSEHENAEVRDLFTFSTDPICIGGSALFTGRGVVDVMLTPYLSQL